MEIEKVGSIHVITLPAGDMRYDLTTVPPEDPHEAALLELYRLSSEPRDVVLNFRDVTGFGAFALELLVKGHEAINQAGKRLALCHLSPSLMERLTVTDPVPFTIFDDEETAVNALTHR